MISIEIKSTNISTRTGMSKRTNQPYTMRSQEGWALLHSSAGPQPYPTRIELNLEEGQPPFQPGTYMLDPASLYVGQFSKLSLGRLLLSPVSAKSARAA